jgi:hypothetical protein
MAEANKKDIAELREELKKLKREYQDLTGEPLTIIKPDTLTNVREVNEAIKTVKASIESAERSNLRFSTGFRDIHDEIIAITGELSKSNSNINLATKAFKGTQDIVQKLKYDEQDITKLSLKDLELSKEKLKQQQKETTERAQALAVEKGIENIAKVNLKFRRDLSESERALLEGLKAEFPIYDDINDRLAKRIHEEEQINKLLGLGGAALHSIEHTMEHIGLGSLAHHLGIEEANEKMREMAEEIEKAGENVNSFANKFEVLKTGLSSIGKSFTHHLTDPAVVMTALVGGLVHAFQHVDKEISEVAKDLGIGRDEAQSMVLEMEHMANHSNNVFINTEKLVKANTELNKLFGTAVVMNEEMLVSYTELTTQAGYSVEEASKLAQISVANGDSIKENTSAILGQVAALNAENGLAINTKDIMADISKISSATTLTLGNQPEKLAAAAYKAKQFGMELSKVESISQGLLNFEDSISAELEAELLTGKEINLEKARQAALDGDLATVAEEIAKQTGNAKDFAEMNVIQQEALAKSVGMTRDDLAKSLMDREAMVKLADQEGDTAQERFNNLVKEVGVEEAKKRIGDEQLANQLASVSSQEKLAAAATKLQEIFASLVTPLMPVLDIFGSIFEIIGPIVGAVGTFVGYLSSALKLTIDIGKYLIPIYGLYKGIQVFQTASLAVNRANFALKSLEMGQEAFISREKSVQGIMEKQSLGTKIAYNLQLLAGLITEQGIAGVKTYANTLDDKSIAKKAIMKVYDTGSFIMEQGKAGFKLLQIGYETTLNGIKRIGALISKGELLSSIGKAAMGVISSLSSIPVVGWALGIAASAGAIALGYKFLKGDDVVSGGYGKRTLMAPEGAIALNDKDTVIAGTDLGGKNKSKNTTSESPSQTNTTPSIDITPLVDRMAAVEGLLSQILQKETNIYMDSTKVGTGFAMSTSKIQ